MALVAGLMEGSGMVPSILLTHTLDWPNAARLAIAFRQADCRVHVLCHAKHPIRSISRLDGIHTHNSFAPLRTLRAAIQASQADFVIPCDDPAVTQLHRLYRQLRDSDHLSGKHVKELIERSLGNVDAHHRAATRSGLGEIVRATEVLLPQTDVIRSVDEMERWLKQHGYPAVLKTDYSWGGYGVRIVENLKQARAAFAAMSRHGSSIRALKRMMIDRDPDLLKQKILNRKPVVSIQSFVAGKLANIAVACWKGEVLASLCVEVVASHHNTGTSTVVRRVDNPQMLLTSKRIIRKLGISGFCGLDFILQEGSEQAYLLEINPRATQINHLVFGAGHDLPGSLRAKIADEPIRESWPICSSDTIAMFPQELYRDPDSKYLHTAFHDIPSDEPGLIQAYLAMHPAGPNVRVPVGQVR
jgi:hypothetical protein